ncbi:hypothetical protein D9758_017640 [Tetrapyrgos nigripes]|uniref:Uncharacterized protein n=1 Tax=Tetrapyrgos nigripes TaxID=182062 RepID=A0A8H5CFD6_9AGAR|nr:hypothetical protein D9758_017640 [Tetrapyrgos nigripes]
MSVARKFFRGPSQSQARGDDEESHITVRESDTKPSPTKRDYRTIFTGRSRKKSVLSTSAGQDDAQEGLSHMMTRPRSLFNEQAIALPLQPRASTSNPSLPSLAQPTPAAHLASSKSSKLAKARVKAGTQTDYTHSPTRPSMDLGDLFVKPKNPIQCEPLCKNPASPYSDHNLSRYSSSSSDTVTPTSMGNTRSLTTLAVRTPAGNNVPSVPPNLPDSCTVPHLSPDGSPSGRNTGSSSSSSSTPMLTKSKSRLIMPSPTLSAFASTPIPDAEMGTSASELQHALHKRDTQINTMLSIIYKQIKELEARILSTETKVAGLERLLGEIGRDQGRDINLT